MMFNPTEKEERRYLEEILIISPNKVFADYISNVLPELGEEKIGETGMEELASELVKKKYRFQTFSEQVEKIIDNKDQKFIERIRFKSSHELIGKLNSFAAHIENRYFIPNDLKVNRYYVPYTLVEQKFKAYSRLPLFKRLAVIAREVAGFVRSTHKTDLGAADVNKIEADIKRMMVISNLRDLYRDFYEWLGKPEMFRQDSRSRFEYADVYPLIYLKIKLEGINSNDRIKHLIIDEMQDYSPVQYAVIARLFPCKKTILGDYNQAVNPFSFSATEDIERVFTGADCVKLTKSYRSTFEITDFAQNISRNDELVPVERHGEHPKVSGFKSKEQEMESIEKLVSRFKTSGYNSLGIICKNHQQAEMLHEFFKKRSSEVYLLNSQSTAFVNGPLITTAHMAKGLEFDQVIVPFASGGNYKTTTDIRMLYIACTRALHKLDITFTGDPVSCVQQEAG